jgi:fructose-1,6-bisphosphatase/inositol monophosphatase family enzyme
LKNPESEIIRIDGTVNYYRSIPQHGGRYLCVVVNEKPSTPVVVTLFFDRRLGRKDEA